MPRSTRSTDTSSNTTATPRSQSTVTVSELQIGQSLLMNGKWRTILDIETPDNAQDDLKLVLNPNVPGTRFLKLNPTRPVEARASNE